MFDTLTGIISYVKEKEITLLVGGIGFRLNIPNTQNITQDSKSTLYIYFHWNTEKGPSLYGFDSELDRKVFLLIIDCPKIGPSIGLNILSQLSSGQFLEIVTTGNDEALSKVNGIGNKKAEQIIVALKRKVQKLISGGELKIEQQQGVAQWQQLNQVLSSLNYTRPEISRATQYLSEKYSGKEYSFDQLIRSALAFLSQKQL